MEFLAIGTKLLFSNETVAFLLCYNLVLIVAANHGCKFEVIVLINFYLLYCFVECILLIIIISWCFFLEFHHQPVLFRSERGNLTHHNNARFQFEFLCDQLAFFYYFDFDAFGLNKKLLNVINYLLILVGLYCYFIYVNVVLLVYVGKKIVLENKKALIRRYKLYIFFPKCCLLSALWVFL